MQFTKDWLSKLLVKQPNLLDKFQIANLTDEYKINLLGEYEYIIKIVFTDEFEGKARLEDGVITITISKKVDEFLQRKMVRELISKVLAKVFKQYVAMRIEDLNRKHFQKQIKGVTLRYNSTRWGSCSSSGRINISTRSLLLPDHAFEYILVHELSHMVEMNHSKAFWDVVESVMPTYQEEERYIKAYGSSLDF